MRDSEEEKAVLIADFFLLSTRKNTEKRCIYRKEVVQM